ncbi:MAG: GNAT family N-acetyltransferase, partial [Acidimicrobiales bacterium]
RYLSVFNMYTREQHRRQGLAQEILQALESWALSMGAEGATLQVTIDNQAAQGLYSRLGYAPVYQYRYSRAPRLT